MSAGPARTAIVGVGHSKVYRHDEVTLGLLAVDACRKAIEDAGLTPADIDGVAVDPMSPFQGAGDVDGKSSVRPEFIISALGLDVCWYESVSGSISRALIEAINAVASGNCKAALAYRALHNPQGRYGQIAPAGAPGPAQYTFPYGLFAPAMYAHLWTRYMHDYGTTREQMAPFIVNNRQNALLWEHGYWYQHNPHPLSVEDYLNARMISEPLCLFDCDIPVQGCGAFVITSADRAPDLPHPPAYVSGWALPGGSSGSTYTTLDVMRERATQLARRLYENAGVKVTDVDVANLYDGFSIFVPLWLETLGFCEEGEGFDFMTPDRISLNGTLPLNTSSGNLGAGRMHGVPHYMDSVLQVMGRSGARQVKKADVALVAGTGAPGTAPAMILTSVP
jgi:acetyl-CoA acetyltransferase